MKSNYRNKKSSIKNMRGGARIPPPPPPVLPPPPPNYNTIGPNSELDPKLFQIINSQINTIVSNLKIRLGNNIQVTNKNAKEIMNLFNNFSNNITRDIVKIVGEQQNITIDGPEGERTTQNSNSYFQDFAAADKVRLQGMKNLDDVSPDKLATSNDDQNLDLSIPEDNKKLTDRLINCQNLEILYLIKHDELMTTFTFSLNLFDKYKYAVKMILLLLKSLVYKTEKPDPGPGKGRVKLPAKIIKEIDILLRDQGVVQDVINQMKTTLFKDPNPENQFHDSNPIAKLHKLTQKQSPPEPSEQAIADPIDDKNIPA